MGAPTHRQATTRMAMVVGWCERVRECVRARMYVRACVRECARACVRACVRASVRACVRACLMCLQYTIIILYTQADMIIIKHIFLYFIEIAHTDDLNGYPASYLYI